MHLLAAKITVSCTEIGNCSTKSPTLSVGLANIAAGIMILVGSLAIIFMVVSGLQIALSNGDPKRYQQGRDGLQYSVIGLVVAIMAYAIVSYVAKAF